MILLLGEDAHKHSNRKASGYRLDWILAHVVSRTAVRCLNSLSSFLGCSFGGLAEGLGPRPGEPSE